MKSAEELKLLPTLSSKSPDDESALGSCRHTNTSHTILKKNREVANVDLNPQPFSNIDDEEHEIYKSNDHDDYLVNEEERDPPPDEKLSKRVTFSSNLITNYTADITSPRPFHQQCQNVYFSIPCQQTCLSTAKPSGIVDSSYLSPQQVMHKKKTHTNTRRNLPQAVARLFDLSKDKQQEGKKRREEIALASHRRKHIPNSEDFGVLPASRASDMYDKGMRNLRSKNLRIAEERVNMFNRDHESTKHAASSRPTPGGINSSTSCDLLKQNSDSCVNFVSPPQTSKKLPLSRSDDMYTRSLKFIQAKQARIHHAHHNKILDQGLGHNKSSKKMPMSRANDMYNKSLRALGERDMKIAQYAANKECKKDDSLLKLPLSRSMNMYEKSIKYIHAKHERLRQAKKEMQQEVRPKIARPSRIRKSRDPHVHNEGMESLVQAKQEEVIKLFEADRISYNFSSPSSEAACVHERQIGRVRAKTVKQVVEDYCNQKIITLRPSDALYLADYLTGSVINATIPTDISTLTSESFGTRTTTSTLSSSVPQKEEKPNKSKINCNGICVSDCMGNPPPMIVPWAACHRENKENSSSTSLINKTNLFSTLMGGCLGDLIPASGDHPQSFSAHDDDYYDVISRLRLVLRDNKVQSNGPPGSGTNFDHLSSGEYTIMRG